MTQVTVKHLWKEFAGQVVLENVNLHVGDHEFVTIVGAFVLSGLALGFGAVLGLANVSAATVRAAPDVLGALDLAPVVDCGPQDMQEGGARRRVGQRPVARHQLGQIA